VYQRREQRKTAVKSSANAHTVPLRQSTTVAAAKKRTNTHVGSSVIQRGLQWKGRPLQSTRARRLLSRAATAAAGNACVCTYARVCTRLFSRRRTGHGAGAGAPGAATPPTNGPQTESFPNAAAHPRRSRGALPLPLRIRSQSGLHVSTKNVLDGVAGGTTSQYAPKTGGRPRSPPRLVGIERSPFLPVTLGAKQATPSVTLRSTRGLPELRASINRHSAPCATCGARLTVHGGRPFGGVAGELHRESASD